MGGASVPTLFFQFAAI
ncbi:DUF6053 domain-containing protein [Lysobacter enzymogenes]